MKSFGSYGVVSAKSVVGEDAALIEELLFRGFVVLPDVIDRVQVDELCCRLDAVYARQCDEIGGEENLALINDLDIVRCPLAYDESFLDMAANAKFIRLVKSLLGDNIVLLMQNGVINRPDRIQFQTNWHRDLNYQHWVCSKPIAVSALVCLEDFDQETGGTVFLSGSHKFEQFPSPPFAERAAETPNVPRGSVIVFDAMTFHRAGINRSNRVRRGVNHVIGVPILAQQVDIPAMLDREPPTDPWLAGYLGYRWKAATNVRGWRMGKIAQAQSKMAREKHSSGAAEWSGAKASTGR
jgi:ectoine hydroxylase-related dioxygenase (phytanoyl-CoA dioxygenase family)